MAARKRFFKRLLTGLKYKPRRIVTDGLRSYGAARREILPGVRRRERQMQRFKPPEQAQRCLSSHAMIYDRFRPRRHLMTAAQYRRTCEGLPDLATGDMGPDGSVRS